MISFKQPGRRMLTALLGLALSGYSHADVVFQHNKDLQISINAGEPPVAQTALDIFKKDYRAVFGGEVVKVQNGQVFIGTLGNKSPAEKSIDQALLDKLILHKEAYAIQVKKDKLYIVGSDKRGTAYGILELSRAIGVSPWEWWADVAIKRKKSFRFAEGYKKIDHPSVSYRGIFLNDEDWGINPWSYLTHEPSEIKGQIGPKTHARIFELLLRLRANMFWPAMHSCSQAFYQTPGNKEVADKYGIIVGTSHCEPMMRNANAEWKQEERGAYDYVHNRENVLKFWEDRVRQLSQSDNVYTLGIRGIHDGKMQGANTLTEQKDALSGVIKDQREMIAKYLNPDVTKIPQVFIPYKEVLDVYRMGLKVPDDVTLMWTDDNYGYIRHFPDNRERSRKGGNGIYYHISYWGRPHDYLWLATHHPAQIYTQMKMAYDKGAKDIWILNVGDVKPAEYLTELFLDIAWDIDAIAHNKSELEAHLFRWLSREFGEKSAKNLLPVMNEYYRLAYIRKPEFMGNTRTEEKDPAYKLVADLPWSEKEIRSRLAAYQAISDKVEALSEKIESENRNAWFELVEYPVRAAAEMNKKHLYGQLARHGLANWEQSDLAFNILVALTQQYNSLANGKWNRIMDFQPRNLAVFERLTHDNARDSLPVYEAPAFLFNGVEYHRFSGKKPLVYGLGYESGAISLEKDTRVAYQFKQPAADTLWLEIALAPNHPVDGKNLRIELSIDDQLLKTIDYQTYGRSEEWKRNVLSNQAIRIIACKLKKEESKKTHVLQVKALDEGIVLDQLKIWVKKPKTSYSM